MAVNPSHVQRYIDAGLRVMPDEGKRPIIKDWPTMAPLTDEQITEYWGNGHDHTVGLICGRQPSGAVIHVVDVDPKNGGELGIKRLEAELGDLPPTAKHYTPSGGYHLFFTLPDDLVIGNIKLADGVDTRGTGGQVVLPPSMINGKPYVATRTEALLTTPVAQLPEAWIDRLLGLDRPIVQASVDRHPSAQPGPSWSAADWVRDNLGWPEALERNGWICDGGEYWVRPGKSPRDGHSAVLKNDGHGPLNVFSSEVPTLERVGKLSADGTCYSVSLFDFLAAYEHGGDRRALSKAIWESHGRPAPAAVVPYRTGDTTASADTEAHAGSRVASTAPNLPQEFWESRPWLTHLRDAALSQMQTPDSVLVAVLARLSAQIHYNIDLRTALGRGSLDYVGCIVAASGVGKSKSMDVAEELLPVVFTSDDRYLWDQVPSSGEGILEGYYARVPNTDPDGPKTIRKKHRVSLHMRVDEIMGMLQRAARSGSTLLSELCKLYSGETVGTLNAEGERNRQVNRGTYRFALVGGIQVDLTRALFEPAVQEQGLTSRFVFASAVMTERPEISALPDWPGPLDLPVPPGYEVMPQTVTFADSINDEIRQQRYAAWGGDVDTAQGHQIQVVKLAALFALAGGTFHVEHADWELAKAVRANSEAVIEWMRQWHQVRSEEADEVSAARQARREMRVTSVKEGRQMHTWAVKIQRLAGADGGITMGRCRADFASSEYRHMFDEALALAVANGFVRVDEKRIYAV